MYTDEDLDAAVAAGALTADAAASFRAFTARSRATTHADEEMVRLVSSFNDIFVVVASVLMLGAVGYLGARIAPWIGGAAVAGTGWLLAEYFTRKRAMALPSIVLLLAVVGGIFAAGALAPRGTFEPGSAGFAIGGVAAGIGAWLHWRRFRVPITVAAGVGVMVAALLASAMSAPTLGRWASALMFVAGAAVFALAMRWDISDPTRRTRRSDVAFWLHLLAAPLLVHPVFTLIDVRGNPDLIEGIGVLVLYAVLACVALVIDRRALLVSALVYVLYAFNALIGKSLAPDFTVALTALVIGSALLLLSALWTRARAVIVQRLPAALQSRVPMLA